jgi:hypothetical protein
MACALHLGVSWSATKCAFAGIRNRYTEHTAARARGPIQTPRKPIAFGASARHSRNPKLPTVSPQSDKCGCFFRVRLGSKSCSGVLLRRAELRMTQVAPLGYLNSQVNGTRNLVFDPERAGLVRDAFQMIADGQRLEHVLRIVTGLGLRNLKGKTVNNVHQDVLVERVF